MKFWKPILLTTALFSALVSTVVYTGCEKDPCIDVKCENGGSCKIGICTCPTGFEGPTCAFKSADRFLGYYAGFTQCNNGAQIIDTVFVYGDVPKKNNYVYVIQNTHKYDTLQALVITNESTYSLFIGTKVSTNYSKEYHVTLQSDNSMVLHTYERDLTTPGDTVSQKCTFVGVKHKFPVY